MNVYACDDYSCLQIKLYETEKRQFLPRFIEYTQALSAYRGRTDVCSSVGVINLLRDIQQGDFGSVTAGILNGDVDDEKTKNAY